MRLLVVAVLLLAGSLAPVRARQFIAKESDFTCIRNWPVVNHTRVFNQSKRKLKKAMRVLELDALNKKFPQGTILQLWPGEASVKRGGEYNPEGNGWEFFQLNTTAAGTTIGDRGIHTKNAFNHEECQTCHSAAKAFDFVCGHSHGCDPLPLPDSFFDNLQQADPRCAPAK